MTKVWRFYRPRETLNGVEIRHPCFPFDLLSRADPPLTLGLEYYWKRIEDAMKEVQL